MLDKKINDRIQSDYEFLQNAGYKVLGVFLQGSQNYHLEYEGSDIDTKAIVLPGFNDFVLKNMRNSIACGSRDFSASCYYNEVDG